MRNRVLVKRIRNCVIQETHKALLVSAYATSGKLINVWLPKSSTKSELKGYLTISRKVAEENKLKFEEIVITPKTLDPSKANVCNEFYD